MYLPNKYTTTYYTIINRGKDRILSGYKERHHIIPKSLGGSNNDDNLVYLTAKEHFVCHHLLTKMLTGKPKHKMIYALWRFCVVNSTKITASLYEKTKIKRSELISDLMVVEHRTTRKNKPGPNAGRKMSEAAKLKSSNTKKAQNKIAWNRGSKHTEESKILMSQRKKANVNTAWNKGVTHSDEVKQRISELAKNRTVYVCPHCGKSATGGNYKRWHGENCRYRS